MNKLRDPGPVILKPVISEQLQFALWYLGIGAFCGLVIGFLAGVIVKGCFSA